jgi:hypothetical protein
MVATQRFDPRPTAPESGFELARQNKPKRSLSRFILIGVVLLVVIAGIVSTFAVLKNRTRPRVASNEQVFYPGAKKTLDIGAGGGRAVSLETSDSFDQVRQWYQSTIKPEKTVQLTGRSVVMQGGTTTVTIIGDDNKTTVLLKINP